MRKLGLIFLAMVSIAFGQEKKVEDSQLSLLALGKFPPFTYDPNPKHYEPAPWAIPPSKLRVQNEQEESKYIELTLRGMSNGIGISGGKREVRLFGTPWNSKIDEKEWAVLQIPETGTYLGVFIKSQQPKEPSWEMVRSFVLKNDGKSFPAGTMRIFNASSVDIVMKTGEQKGILVRPEATLVDGEVPVGKVLTFAARREDGRMRTIFLNHPPKLKGGERLSVFIYDEKEVRRPVQLRFVVDSVLKEH